MKNTTKGTGHTDASGEVHRHNDGDGPNDPRDPRAHTDRAASAAAVGARIAVAVVFAFNVQCALAFVLQPAAYAGGFELAGAGAAGEAAVRGMGVAFLMWNATYPAVIASPQRFRALFIVVLAQQAIGLVGESLILASLPAGHAALAAGIARFIAFDAAGLALMGAAFAGLLLTAPKRSHPTP